MMRHISRCCVLLALCLIAAGTAWGSGAVSLGHSDGTVLVPASAGGGRADLTCNYDGSFENGYYWDYLGTQSPYYGCFAEAYDLGEGVLESASFWFTQIGYYQPGFPMDVYVWADGVTGPPGIVLTMVPNVTGMVIPYWPQCGETVVPIGCPVYGDFTVGYWADFYLAVGRWFICADEDGPGGHPWTRVAPGLGYPAGWQHPAVVFGDCKALGICASFNTEMADVGESPVEGQTVVSQTWGQIKTLFAW